MKHLPSTYLMKENAMLRQLLARLLTIAMYSEYRDNSLAKAIRRFYEENKHEL